jgi:hypothetical protein
MSIKKALSLFIFPLLTFIPLACYVESHLIEIDDAYQPVISSRPAAWWKLDDIRNNQTPDSSGHNLHGSVWGAVCADNAMYFDGQDDCVKVPDSPLLRPDRITVQAWFKPKRISQAVLLEKAPGGVYPPQKGWEIHIDTEANPKNSLTAWILNRGIGGAGVTSKTIIRPDRWYHLAMTYDGRYLKLYINGALEASQPYSAGIGDNSAASLSIGYSEYWNHNYFNGLIKDARIYSYARSAGEIRADYNRDSPDNSFIESTQRNDGPAAWWKLDDITGKTAFDSSGHRLNGRVRGAAWSGQSLSFDGTDDFVEIPGAAKLDITGSITIEAWINRAASGIQHSIIGKWLWLAEKPVNHRSYYIQVYSDDKLDFFLSPDGSHANSARLRSRTTIAPNQWHHIAGVYNGSSMKLYINGVLDNSMPYYKGIYSRINTPVAIGIQNHNGPLHTPFNGLLKDIKIYNYALSYGEIQTDYNSNRPDENNWQAEYEPSGPGADWLRMYPSRAPSARFVYAMSYDSARNKTVLFGGTTTGYDKLNDTWEWDGGNWAEKRPLNSPSARGYLAMAYDSSRQKTVLFGGGYYGSVYFNDTWEWDGTNWAQRYPKISPPARVNHALAYDSARRKVVLFGGFYEGTSMNDTWEWDGINWARIYPKTSPSGCHYHAMTYDSARQKTVLFGGENSTATHIRNNETWEWDGRNWTLKSSYKKPTARAIPAMAYDPARQKAILFGGDSNDDTWEWDGKSWTRLYPANNPSARGGHCLIYDSARRKIVLFGGAIAQGVSSNETWEYDHSSGWQKINPSYKK